MTTEQMDAFDALTGAPELAEGLRVRDELVQDLEAAGFQKSTYDSLDVAEWLIMNGWVKGRP
jgi:hypothetical protein